MYHFIGISPLPELLLTLEPIATLRDERAMVPKLTQEA